MRARFEAVALAGIAVVACGLVSGCSDTRFESPESTLETAKVAFADHDYDQFCDCLSDDGRDQMAASMVFMQLAAEGDKSDEAKEIAAVLEKHGLNNDNNPKVNFNLNGSEEEKKKQLKKLVEPIKDRSAFIVDMIAVLRKHSDKPDARLFESDAKLVDLKIDGQVATATLVQTRDDKEQTAPITFAKIGNSWKIDDFQFN